MGPGDRETTVVGRIRIPETQLPPWCLQSSRAGPELQVVGTDSYPSMYVLGCTSMPISKISARGMKPAIQQADREQPPYDIGTDPVLSPNSSGGNPIKPSLAIERVSGDCSGTVDRPIFFAASRCRAHLPAPVGGTRSDE